MNTRNLWKWIGTVSVLIAASLLPTGCDDPNTSELDGYFESHPLISDPRSTSTQVVSISPSSATISTIGGRIMFRATGGSDGYTWDVSNTSIGSITPSGDAQAVYVATAIGNNEVVVYDRSGNAAIAYISGSAETVITITANPPTLSVDNAMCVVSVTGGSAPYYWTVTDPNRGKFPDGNTGSSVVYLRKSAGDNAVTVTDGSGDHQSLIISQP